jgi:probable addiction module antidote protein
MTKTSKHNPFDYLETHEEISQYLNNAYMDDDPKMFIIALGYLAKKRGMTELAAKTGMNRASLYKALSGKGNPHFETISKVSKALGCRLAVV